MNAHRAWTPQPERRTAAADDGMTLVELLVAISIMLIVLAGVAAGASSGLQLARGNTNRVVAANVADQQISAVRAMEFSDIPQSTVTGTVTQGATQYTWTRRAEMVIEGADESCEAPSGAFNADTLSYLRVIVEVTWPRMEGIDPVRSETLIDPPVADYDNLRGHIAVQVTDRVGVPVANMTVQLRNATTATPATSRFEVTDADGCVFFDDLEIKSGQATGDYEVSLNQSGWVDRATGLQNPRPVVAVGPGQLTKFDFNYDRAAYLDVTLDGRHGGTPALNLPVTIANDNYNNGNGPVRFASVAVLRAQALHPFTGGFSVWAGDCADSDPGDARTRLATNPGAITSGADGVVPIGTVQMTVYRRVSSNNVAVQGATILATDQCGTGYRAATATDAAGTATIALPFGRWTLSVEGYSPRQPNSWPMVTLSPGDTVAQTVNKRVR